MRRMLLPLCALLLPLALHQDDPERPTPHDAPPAPGERAPALRLNGHDGRAVGVGGESKHWTLLAFYPKAATPG